MSTITVSLSVTELGHIITALKDYESKCANKPVHAGVLAVLDKCKKRQGRLLWRDFGVAS